ncbi:hypothetical protein HMI55_003213 [Coelomomyces lativittatus]|nr:hypothetical protein HMI55_003213 [Coelomomyces lativittatus]
MSRNYLDPDYIRELSARVEEVEASKSPNMKLQNELQSALNAIQALAHRLDEMQIQTSTPIVREEKTFELPLPKRFDGTRGQFETFAMQIRLLFRAHPERFPTPMIRTCLIISLLDGMAAQWIKPMINDDPCCFTYEEILEILGRQFGDPCRGSTARRELLRIRQGWKETCLHQCT